MSKIYAMSDIHGHYDEFIESLSKWIYLIRTIDLYCFMTT